MITAGDTVVYSPQNVALSVGPILFLSNGIPEINLTGFPQETYTVQVSSDLINWSYLTVLSLTNTNGQFLDPAGTNYPHHFYRVCINQ